MADKKQHAPPVINTPEGAFISTDGLAKQLNVTRQTVYEMSKRGDLPKPRRIGKSNYYPIPDHSVLADAVRAPEPEEAAETTHQPANHAELRELLEARVPLGSIDTSRITSMRSLGSLLNNYTGEELRELKDWDVSAVTDFSFMFEGVEKLSADLSGWNVGSGEWFVGTFRGCRYFNSDISGWNTSSAQSMKGMLMDCHEFNQDLGGWDVSAVWDFSQMFRGCYKFTADLSRWQTGRAEAMVEMFRDCFRFNADIRRWQVDKVQSFHKMLHQCVNFSYDLSGWDRRSEMDYDDYLETLHRPDAVDDPDAGVDDPDQEEERK